MKNAMMTQKGMISLAERKNRRLKVFLRRSYTDIHVGAVSGKNRIGMVLEVECEWNHVRYYVW